MKDLEQQFPTLEKVFKQISKKKKKAVEKNGCKQLYFFPNINQLRKTNSYIYEAYWKRFKKVQKKVFLRIKREKREKGFLEWNNMETTCTINQEAPDLRDIV